jgi:EmrB/QacA subfamily drug resistance transporter
MQYKYTVLTNTTIGAFMAQLDSNIVLISLPTIVRDLHASAFDALWVVMAYILAIASLLLAFGRLADMYGRIRLYNAGFAVFTVGSGLCSISPNGPSLVLFRAVQGIGAALVFSNSAAILTDAFPPDERGRAIGINQVAGVSGSVLGLVAGGILTSTLGWPSVFWINLPVGAFATIWGYTKLRELAVLKRERPDLLGNLLFGFGLTVFLVGITLGALEGFSSILAGMVFAGLGSMGVFFYAETKVRWPMMDISLFKIRQFTAGILSNLLASVARGGVLLVLTFYFQGALLLDAFAAGIRLLPFSIAFVGIGPLSGYLSDKYGARGFSTLGMLVSGSAFLLFASLPTGVSYDILVIPMIMDGIGAGMFIAPNIASIMNATPMNRRGVASGMSATLLTTGSLLSLSIAFVIMAASIPLNVLQAIFAGLPVSSTSMVNLDAFTNSMRANFLVMAGLSFAAAIPSALRGQRMVGAPAGTPVMAE